MDHENSTAAESAPCAPDGAKPASAASASGSAQADPFFIPPPVVSNVVARQRWPWNGLVDVDYEVGGHESLLTGLTARVSFAAADGRSWTATNFLANAEPKAELGHNRATWDTKADGVTNVVAEHVTATVELLREE